mgnify:CR=1 FL=1
MVTVASDQEAKPQVAKDPQNPFLEDEQKQQNDAKCRRALSEATNIIFQVQKDVDRIDPYNSDA